MTPRLSSDEGLPHKNELVLPIVWLRVLFEPLFVFSFIIQITETASYLPMTVAYVINKKEKTLFSIAFPDRTISLSAATVDMHM